GTVHHAVAAVSGGGLRVRILGRVADEARLQFAIGRTTRNVRALVALLWASHDAVAADGHASRAGEGTDPPGHDLACLRAAASAVVDAVVALLGASHLAIPAHHRNARAAGGRTDGVRHDGAGRAAAVGAIDDPVVALLGSGQNAVTASVRDARV